MKPLLLFSLMMLIGNAVFSQPGCVTTRVVNPLVTQPTAASIVSSTCSTLVVTWQGSAGQTYYINATRYNPTTNVKDTVADASISRSCNGSNSCTATIPVVAGTQVTWSVQAISTISGSIYYSYPVEGTPVNYPILACGVAANTVTLSGKVFLQGAYDSVANTMRNTLNTSGILQSNATNQPYNIAAFNYTGNENVGAGFFAAHSNIVDWVMIELRDSVVAPSIIAIRAAFVQRDGSLVDTNGTNTKIVFNNMQPGKYYVAIRHRNHLAICTSAPVDFNTGTANYDFTTAANKTYQSQTYSSTVLMGGVWVMRGGDANVNGESKYQGPSNDRASILTALGSELAILTGYYATDLNMDGQVKYQGPGNDRGFLLSTALSNDELRIFKHQLPQ